MSRGRACGRPKASKKNKFPGDAPPSPPVPHRLIREMEVLSKAKSEQDLETAVRKLSDAEDRIRDLEMGMLQMSSETALKDERIETLVDELKRSEQIQASFRHSLLSVKAGAATPEDLRVEIDGLRAENEGLRKEIAVLRGKADAMSADLDSMEALRRRLAIAEDQRSRAMCMLNDAEDRMEYLRMNRGPRMEAEPRREPEIIEEPEDIRVTRTDRNCLSSPVFGFKRYSVKMNLAKTTMLITPSNDGRVPCRDYCLEISGLERLLPFNGAEELRAETVVGTKSIKIILEETS